MEMPVKENIENAHSRIKNLIHKTPVLSSSLINEFTGAKLYFKCENLQKVGAFKFRGASNAVSKLTVNQMKSGVTTHSSGNHAAALSLAAKMKGIEAHIVMPHTAPKIKIAAVKAYGGQIHFCEPSLEAREKELEKVQAETGAHFIHPFDNYDVIEGQATAAKELIEEIPNLDFIFAPVGGGGLLSGTILSSKYFGKNIKVIGAEPAGADDAFRSIRDGKIYPSVSPKTICDGLLTSLSEKTYRIISGGVDEIITVSENQIIEAMKLIWTRMKIIIEPSSAVVLAAVISNSVSFVNKKIGLILSGGNIDLENLPWNK